MFILVIKNSENVEIKLIIHTIFIVFAESITVFSLYVSNIYHSFFPLEAILSQIVTTNVLIRNPNICAIDIKDECNFFCGGKLSIGVWILAYQLLGCLLTFCFPPLVQFHIDELCSNSNCMSSLNI